jgi:hypothetical protein
VLLATAKEAFFDIFKADKEMKVKEIIKCYKENKLDAISLPNAYKKNFK